VRRFFAAFESKSKHPATTTPNLQTTTPTYNATDKFPSPIFPGLTFDSAQIFRGI
jgi:hypothetical protein